MIAREFHCDPGQLSALLGDTLDEKRQAAVTQHLDHCVHCRQQLEQLTASEEWWDDARQTLRELRSDRTSPLAATQAIDVFGHCAKADADAVANEQHWVLALLQPSPDPAALGEIDGMAVDSVVGQGGMGVVLRVRDPRLQRFLAVKLLSPMLAGSGAARQRFFREARAAAAVVHPNIVPIYAVSAERSVPYLVMPYVAGGNLQQVLDGEGPLTVERSLSIGLQVAEGLIAAHRQGIVHRDIKPANLLLDEGGFRILITDFGLARALDDATLTGSGLLAGTPQYMSPEQARGGPIDHRTDIYSLGAVLYALATGRPPLRGDSTLDILRRIGEESPKSLLEINETYPEWYERLVYRLMAPAAAERPQSAEQVAEWLRSALAHARSPHHVPLPQALDSASNSALIRRSPAVAIGVLTIVLVMTGLWLVSGPAGFPLLRTNTWQSAGELGSPTTAPATVPSHATPEPWNSDLLEQLLLSSEQELDGLKQELGSQAKHLPPRPRYSERAEE